MDHNSLSYAKTDPEADKGYPGCTARSRPEVLDETEGTFTSPTGNDNKYPSNAECHWRISVPNGKVSSALNVHIQASEHLVPNAQRH